jgi:hypothetical protein
VTGLLVETSFEVSNSVVSILTRFKAGCLEYLLKKKRRENE